MDSLVKTTGTTLTNSLLDGWDIALEILLIVMALDYLTGVVAAFKTKTVSSSAGYSGLVKKASIFIIVILAAQMDRVIGNDNHISVNSGFMELPDAAHGAANSAWAHDTSRSSRDVKRIAMRNFFIENTS